MRIISGRVGGRRIESPPGQDLRPMMDKVRAALFDMLWHFDAVRGRALDLYAGSGAVGIEALSRGAEYADFVELNAVCVRTIQQNLDTLGLGAEGRVHKRKVEEVIAKPALLGYVGPYDLVTFTPPYPETDYVKLLTKLAASTLIGPGSMVVVEHPREIELPDELGPLTRVRERKYGRTFLSIYDFPSGNDAEETDEDSFELEENGEDEDEEEA